MEYRVFLIRAILYGKVDYLKGNQIEASKTDLIRGNLRVHSVVYQLHFNHII